MMPDGDVIKRGVRFVWRPAFETLCGDPSSAEIGSVISKGLTASLRKRGIPKIAEAADLVKRSWRELIPLREALNRTSGATGSVGGTRDSSLLDIAVRRVLIDGPTGAVPEQAILEEFLKVRVESELISKLRPAMLETDSMAPQDVERLCGNWMGAVEPAVRDIAAQLLKDPTGVRLRANNPRKRTKKSTADLLDEGV